MTVMTHMRNGSITKSIRIMSIGIVNGNITRNTGAKTACTKEENTINADMLMMMDMDTPKGNTVIPVDGIKRRGERGIREI